MQDTAFQPGPELRSTLIGLHRQRFGPGLPISWQGDELARSFSENLAVAKIHFFGGAASLLPQLNPEKDEGYERGEVSGHSYSMLDNNKYQEGGKPLH